MFERLDCYFHYRARTWVAKRVLAFDSHCRAQMGVAKCVNSFQQSLWRSNGGSQMSFIDLCGARTGVRECLLAFDRPSYIN